MGKINFSDDFKRDAVRQITERGYPPAVVRLMPQLLLAELLQICAIHALVDSEIVKLGNGVGNYRVRIPLIHASCSEPSSIKMLTIEP